MSQAVDADKLQEAIEQKKARIGVVGLGYVGLPLTRLFVVALVCLGLVHWAHRFRFTLIDIGLHSLETLITVLCYGAAIVGTGVAVYVVWL